MIQPLVGGMYTGDPERLSVKATMPRLQEMERLRLENRELLIRTERSERAEEQLAMTEHIENKKLEEARKLYEAVLKISPDNADGLKGLDEASRKAGASSSQSGK